MNRSDVIEVGDRKQLFIDDKFIARSTGVRRVVNPPDKREMVMSGEEPWEAGHCGHYATILEDEGVYKLWYDGFVGLDVSEAVPRNVCYATSTDGVRFERQYVNLFNWLGHKKNNIVIPGGGGGVMIDPHSDEHRYKALTNLHPSSFWPEAEGVHWDLSGGSVHLMTSPDGIVWKRVRPVASPFFHDSQNALFYDDRIGRYVAYMRTHLRGRTVSRVELDDPMQTPWPYTPPPEDVKPNEHGLYICDRHGAYDVVLACDELDPPDTDVQICPVVKYGWAEDVYVGLFTPYRHYPETVEGKFLNDGPQDIQLAVSRDGISWARPERKPYVALGPAGSWDAGCLWPSLGMIRSGDEIWQYTSATFHTHGARRREGTPGLGRREGIQRLVQRLDGFVSIDFDYAGGELTTPLLTFSGTRLSLNVDNSALGETRVEVLDEHGQPIEGYGPADAVAIDRNHIAAEVDWSSGRGIGELQGRPIRLHIVSRASKLYAFQFAGRSGTA